MGSNNRKLKNIFYLAKNNAKAITWTSWALLLLTPFLATLLLSFDDILPLNKIVETGVPVVHHALVPGYNIGSRKLDITGHYSSSSGDKVFYTPADNEVVNKIIKNLERLQGFQGKFIGVSSLSRVF